MEIWSTYCTTRCEIFRSALKNGYNGTLSSLKMLLDCKVHFVHPFGNTKPVSRVLAWNTRTHLHQYFKWFWSSGSSYSSVWRHSFRSLCWKFPAFARIYNFIDRPQFRGQDQDASVWILPLYVFGLLATCLFRQRYSVCRLVRGDCLRSSIANKKIVTTYSGYLQWFIVAL